MSGVAQEGNLEVECPHCHRPFAAEPLRGGRAARYRGFKCPHCKLFVPLERTGAGARLDPPSRETDGAS